MSKLFSACSNSADCDLKVLVDITILHTFQTSIFLYHNTEGTQQKKNTLWESGELLFLKWIMKLLIYYKNLHTHTVGRKFGLH